MLTSDAVKLHIGGQFLDETTRPAIPSVTEGSCTYYDLAAQTTAKTKSRDVGPIEYAIGTEKHSLVAADNAYPIADHDPVPVGTMLSFAQKSATGALGTFEGTLQTVAPLTLKPGIWQAVAAGSHTLSRATPAVFEWEPGTGRVLLQIIPNNDIGTYPHQIQCEVEASTGRLEVPAKLLGKLPSGAAFGMFSATQTKTIETSRGDEVELQSFVRSNLDGKTLNHFLLELE